MRLLDLLGAQSKGISTIFHARTPGLGVLATVRYSKIGEGRKAAAIDLFNNTAVCHFDASQTIRAIPAVPIVLAGSAQCYGFLAQ